MDFARSQNRLISFAVSAMLTSAFLSTAPSSFITAGAGPQPMAILNAIRAEGWHGAQGVELPTPAAEPASAAPLASVPAKPLSEEQLQKICKWIADHGSVSTDIKKLTDALGLTKNDEKLTLPGMSTHDAENVIYIIQILNDGKGYVVADVNHELFHVYWVDKNLDLVSAVSMIKGQTPAAMPIKDAAAGINHDLAFWAFSTTKW